MTWAPPSLRFLHHRSCFRSLERRDFAAACPVDRAIAEPGALLSVDLLGVRGGAEGRLGAEVEAQYVTDVARGYELYLANCATCHGDTGLADGPVAKVFPGVLPLVGVVKARTDGHIYTTIRYGRRRMPTYGRIPSRDRWDIVNYVRYLDQKGGRP